MKVDVNAEKPRQKYFLSTEALLKYFLGTSDKIDTLIKCRSENIILQTTDYELYKALGSMEKYDALSKAKLVKLLENTDVQSNRKLKGKEKEILTFEKVDEIRKNALNEDKGDKNG